MSGDQVDRCTSLYTRADRQQDQRCALQCVHEDKGLREHRVADILTTTITIGLTNPLVALRVKLTLSSQSDSRHSVSPPVVEHVKSPRL